MKYLGKQSIFDDLMIGGVLLTPPDPATYSYELTLPNDDGTAGQLLTTDGNGVLSWTTVTPGTGTVTSITPAADVGSGTAITGAGTLTFTGGSNLTTSVSGTTVTFYATGSGVAMTNGVDDRVMTATGAAAITGESTLTYNATDELLTIGEMLLRGESGTYNGAPVASYIELPSTESFGSGVGSVIKVADTSSSSGASLWIEGGDADGTNKDGGNMTFKLGTRTGTGATGIFDFIGGGGSQIAKIYDTGLRFPIADQAIVFEGGSYDTTFKAATTVSGSAKTITLPDATGTVALTSDIPAAYTLPLATTSVRGGVELGSDTDLTETYQTGVTGASGKTYPVQLNAANQMGVSVPWTDNNTTYTAGNGLDLSGTTFSTDLKSNGGLVIESTELAVDLGASSITGTLAVGDGGTGLTTVGTNYMLTGNATSALSAESLAQFNGSTGRMNVGLALSQFEVGGWYASGSPSAESPGSGSTMVLKTYNLGGTALPNLFKIAGSGQGGNEPQFRIEGGEANGTDKTGGDIHIIGGAGTGDDPSGKFEFHGHPGGGGTGSSNNSTSVKFTIQPDGDVSMSGDLTVSGGDITLSGTGRIQGIDTVSAATDAASKGYVDGLIPTVPDEVVSAGTHILKQTKVTINQASCNALNSSPVPLVAAQGANKIIIPVEVTCLVDRAAPDTSLGDLIVGWNSTTTYTYALKYARRWMYGILTDMTFVLGTYAGKGAASLTGGENVPLTIATSTGMTSNSLTSMTVYTSYYVIDNS